jgi:hypothetical protein
MTGQSLPRAAALLAINLLFLMVWGFTGIGKLRAGPPDWFPDKFGSTFLKTFPGLGAAFWLLTLSEVLAFALAAVALVRGEFLGRTRPVWLTWMMVWSLFVFVQLGFGQWLTNEFNGTAMLFSYFAGTLVCLHFTGGADAGRKS